MDRLCALGVWSISPLWTFGFAWRALYFLWQKMESYWSVSM
jgi:hypothetical protein